MVPNEMNVAIAYAIIIILIGPNFLVVTCYGSIDGAMVLHSNDDGNPNTSIPTVVIMIVIMAAMTMMTTVYTWMNQSPWRPSSQQREGGASLLRIR